MKILKTVKRIFFSGPVTICLFASIYLIGRFNLGGKADFSDIVSTYITAPVIGTLLELYIYGFKKLGQRSNVVKIKQKKPFEKWLICAIGFGVFLGLPCSILLFLVNLCVTHPVTFNRIMVLIYILCPVFGFIGGTVFFFVLSKQAK